MPLCYVWCSILRYRRGLSPVLEPSNFSAANCLSASLSLCHSATLPLCLTLELYKHKTTHTHRSTPSRHRARLCPGPKTGLHCRAGLIQSGVQNGQNGFEDGWCIPSAAAHNHQRCHADTGQRRPNLIQAAHSKLHKTTHTHRSTLSRHRARFGPGRGRVCIAVPG